MMNFIIYCDVCWWHEKIGCIVDTCWLSSGGAMVVIKRTVNDFRRRPVFYIR